MTSRPRTRIPTRPIVQTIIAFPRVLDDMETSRLALLQELNLCGTQLVVAVVIDKSFRTYQQNLESVEELIDEVEMDDVVYTAGEDVVHDVIENLTQDLLLGPAYNLLKGTCTNNIELEYNFQECFNALTDKLDWNNPEGDRYSFDLSKPLPLQGCPGHLTIAVDYFFNNDLEYLKTSNPEKTYTPSITKTKAARYEIVGIKDITSTLWSNIKHAYDKDAEKGIKHWGKRRKLWYRCQMNKFSNHNVYSMQKILEGNFVDLHLNDIEDMLLLAVQHKLFHLNDSDIVDFIVALHMFTRSLIIKRRVKDLQLGVERVIYEDLNKQKRVMRADELYKFSDGTFKKVWDALHHRILDFRLGYNKEMSRRNWTTIDKGRSKLMVELIDNVDWDIILDANIKQALWYGDLWNPSWIPNTGNGYSLKDKNKAKTKKTKHENGKSVKSQKVKSKSKLKTCAS
ncbi:hypothetical protein Tco_0827715 [Tanacetum coccineum]